MMKDYEKRRVVQEETVEENYIEDIKEDIKKRPILLFVDLVLGIFCFGIFIFYNPLFTYYSFLHWILFLLFHIAGLGVLYYFYVIEKKRDLRFLFRMILPPVFIIFFIFGTILDSYLKDSKLLNVNYFKPAGINQIVVSGMVFNTGKSAVRRCELKVRVSNSPVDNQDKIGQVDSFFSPMIGLDFLKFNFGISRVQTGGYWNKMQRVTVITEKLEPKSGRNFTARVEFPNRIEYPTVSYYISCK